MRLIIATQNDSKINEIKQILGEGFAFKTYKDFNDWPEVEETGTTFRENAFIKAKALSDKYKAAAIADDSGLVVDALDGAPGVYSSRYCGEDANDQKNIDKLLKELKGISSRQASFKTAVVFIDSKGKIIEAEGQVSGDIINELRGVGGFGYDPVFVPKGYENTFAQMDSADKNKLSHRAKAFELLKKLMKQSGYLE